MKSWVLFPVPLCLPCTLCGVTNQNPDQGHGCHGLQEPAGGSRSACLRSGRLSENMKHTAGSGGAESGEGILPTGSLSQVSGRTTANYQPEA